MSIWGKGPISAKKISSVRDTMREEEKKPTVDLWGKAPVSRERIESTRKKVTPQPQKTSSRQQMQEELEQLRKSYTPGGAFGGRTQEDKDTLHRIQYLENQLSRAKSDDYYQTALKRLSELDEETIGYLDQLRESGTPKATVEMQGIADNRSWEEIYAEQYQMDESVKKALLDKGYTEEQIAQYVKDRTRQANRENYEAEVAKSRAEADNGVMGAVTASAKSIPQKLTGGLGYLSLAVQRAHNGDEPLDYYTPEMVGQAKAQAARQTVSQKLEENTELSTGLTGNVASFLYNTGMSMADSAAIATMTAVGVPPAVGTAFLGGTAATQAAVAAKERGVSDERALLTGLAAGTAEALFEKVSLDKLLSTSPTEGLLGQRVMQGLKNMGIQGAVEGSEELATSLANAITDALINGGQSEYNQKVQDYMAQGKSAEEADRLATKDFVLNLGADFLGGFISGGTMSVGADTARNSAYKRAYGENAQELTDEALEIDPKNETALYAKKRLEKGKTVSGAVLRSLVSQNQRKIDADSASAAETAEETGEAAQDTAEVSGGAEAKRTAVSPIAHNTEFTEEEARYIVEEGAKEFGNAASSVVNSYMRGQDPQMYMAQAKLVFNYGKTMSEEKGIPYALKSPLLKSMDETQIRSLFNAGRMQAKAIPVTAVKGKGEVVLTDGIDYSLLDPVRRKQVTALSSFAKATGYTIELFESKADKDGRYAKELGRFDPATGVIRIDINAGRNKVDDLAHYAMVRVASHEITHSFKKNAPQQYVALRDYVTGVLADKGEFDDLVDDKMRELGVGYETAVDEVVADGCEMMLRDTHFAEKLARENRTLFEKIRDAIHDFFITLRAAFEGVEISHEEAQLLQDAENLQKLWDEALAKSVENVAAAEATTTESGGEVKKSMRAATKEDPVAEAERMEKDGATRDEIFKATGLIRDASGCWVAEMDDSQMKIFPKGDALLANNPEYQRYMELMREGDFFSAEFQELAKKFKNNGGKKTLEQFVQYDELFRRFPEMRNVEFLFRDLGGSSRGYWSAAANAIVLDESLKKGVNQNELSRVAIHEIQHALQHFEKRATGSSVKYWEEKKAQGYKRGKNDKKIKDADAAYRKLFDAAPEDVKRVVREINRAYLAKDYDRAAELADGMAGTEHEDVFWAIDEADFTRRMLRDSNEELTARELYLDTAGEIEARTAAARVGMSAEQRRKKAPDLGWDRAVFADDSGDVMYSKRDSKRTRQSLDTLSYKEVSEMQQELFQRERDLAERKREAESNPELLQAMDDFHSLFDEMRELLPKRRQGNATQAELDRIEEIKVLQDAELRRVAEIQERLGLNAMAEEAEEIRRTKEELRVAADAAWKREGAERENAAIAKAGVSAPEYFRKKALKAFKTTTNFNEAGYLLPDGKLLNFSGGESNHRHRDHREIGEIYEATQGGEALNRFLNDGNIRIMAESPGIDLASGVEPTAEQYAAIRRFVKSHGMKDGQFFVDFSAKDGSRAGNYSYSGRVNADRVINDIKYYYANGEVREQSVASQYYYSFRTGYIPTDRSILASYVPKDSDSNMVKRHIAEYQKNVKELKAMQLKRGQMVHDLEALADNNDPKSKAEKKRLREEIVKTDSLIQGLLDQLSRKERWYGVKEVLQKEKAEIMRKAKAEKKKQLKKYRARWENTESRRKLRERISYRVKTLDKMLRNPTDDKHIPEDLRDLIFAFCEPFTYNPGVFKGKALKRAEVEYYFEGEGKGEVVFDQAKIESLIAKYSALKGKGENNPIADLYDGNIEEMLDLLKTTISGRPLSKLSLGELDVIKDIADHFAFIVKAENEIFVHGRKVKLDETAQGVIAAAKGHKRLAPEIAKGETLDAFEKFLTSGNLRPVYFFRDKGSDMEGLFQSLLDAQSEYAFRMEAAMQFVEETEKATGYSEWGNSEETLALTNSANQQVTLNLQQAMSLLATYERELQSGNLFHVTQGGFLYEKDVTGDITVKGVKVPVVKQVVQAEKAKAHPMSAEDMDKVRTWLGEIDPRVLDYMGKMVEYLSTTMADYGNETSMQLHGYKKFGEGYYWPIKSAEEFLQQEPGKAGFDESRWKHKGFTKATVKGANNPFVLRGFSEVWSNHVSQMCMYSTMAVPQDAFVRVMNYKTQVDPTGSTASESVKSEIRSNYGQKALAYIDTYLSDINGGLLTDPRAGALNRLVSLFKKNAVFGSASVALQQYSAVIRAMVYLDPKYFVRNAGWKKTQDAFERAKQYSGVAIIKEIGGFDTTTGRSGANWLMERDPTELKDKARALFQFGEKDTGYRDRLLTALPAKMDKVGWGHIWIAAENEIADTTDLKRGTDAFYEAVAKRFEEVIELTQVYDSVLTRSENMRGKDGLIKAATSFMAEPTVTMNMFVTAAQDAIAGKDGAKARLAKTAFVLAMSVIVNNILKAFATAGRDKDEDQTIVEKYVEDVVGGIISDVNPLGYVPILRDIKSIWEGYSVEASYAAVISDVYDAWKKWEKNQTVESGFDVLNAVAALFGIPAKNLKRDIMAVLDTFLETAPLSESSKRGFWNATREGLGIMPGVDDKMMEAFEADRKGNEKARKKALDEITRLYEDKAKQYRLEGKEDAAKKAKSSLKSTITSVLKPLYQAAKTQTEKNRIKSLALRVYVGGEQLYNGYDFERYWGED